jgi:hypothetical protein
MWARTLGCFGFGPDARGERVAFPTAVRTARMRGTGSGLVLPNFGSNSFSRVAMLSIINVSRTISIACIRVKKTCERTARDRLIHGGNIYVQTGL